MPIPEVVSVLRGNLRVLPKIKLDKIKQIEILHSSVTNEKFSAKKNLKSWCEKPKM